MAADGRAMDAELDQPGGKLRNVRPFLFVMGPCCGGVGAHDRNDGQSERGSLFEKPDDEAFTAQL